MHALNRSGPPANLAADKVSAAMTAAADLLRALGVAVGASPATPTTPTTPTTVDTPRLGAVSMWQRPDMRDALARRDIGAAYRIMGRHGISQRKIAAATGQSQSEVSEILSGWQVVSYDVLARIAEGLGLAPERLGLTQAEPGLPPTPGDDLQRE